jgi:hypothetical protein
MALDKEMAVFATGPAHLDPIGLLKEPSRSLTFNTKCPSLQGSSTAGMSLFHPDLRNRSQRSSSNFVRPGICPYFTVRIYNAYHAVCI